MPGVSRTEGEQPGVGGRLPRCMGIQQGRCGVQSPAAVARPGGERRYGRSARVVDERVRGAVGDLRAPRGRQLDAGSGPLVGERAQGEVEPGDAERFSGGLRGLLQAGRAGVDSDRLPGLAVTLLQDPREGCRRRFPAVDQRTVGRGLELLVGDDQVGVGGMPTAWLWLAPCRVGRSRVLRDVPELLVCDLRQVVPGLGVMLQDPLHAGGAEQSGRHSANTRAAMSSGSCG